MCGRFTLRASPAELVEIFRLLREPEIPPRYNIAPTQPVAAVREADGGRELAMLRWGLVPAWAKDPAIGSRMINARGESVATKPSFRSAFKHRRCLIPADGFYEWQKTGGRGKQPYLIGVEGSRPFALAGLWERWEKGEGEPLESCTIITTTANDLLADLHDRMPVILDEEDYDRWLDVKQADPGGLQSVLRPFPSERMCFYAVDTVVNSPKNEVPACVEPIAKQGELFDG